MDVGYVTVPAYHCILAQSVTIHVQSQEYLSTVCNWGFFFCILFNSVAKTAMPEQDNKEQ